MNGPSAGTTFGDTIALGELAKSDGTLEASSVLEGRFGSGTTGTNATARTASVICTSATPKVSVTAEPLFNSAGQSTGGYTDTVSYTANVDFTLVGGAQTVSDASTAGTTTATLTSRLNGVGTNVAVSTNSWAATGILSSGNYAGKITILIEPTV